MASFIRSAALALAISSTHTAFLVFAWWAFVGLE
jgi:hypothetical protein